MEASRAEKNIYGEDVKLHPVTRMPLEQGIGCLPIDVQAEFHCQAIERDHGKHIADAMREKMAAQKVMTQANAHLAEAEGEQHAASSI